MMPCWGSHTHAQIMHADKSTHTSSRVALCTLGESSRSKTQAWIFEGKNYAVPHGQGYALHVCVYMHVRACTYVCVCTCVCVCFRANPCVCVRMGPCARVRGHSYLCSHLVLPSCAAWPRPDGSRQCSVVPGTCRSPPRRHPRSSRSRPPDRQGTRGVGTATNTHLTSGESSQK